MVDHNSMREAMDRALDEVHNKHCNQCKSPFLENTGAYTQLVTYNKIYQIWYCKDCYDVEI